MESKDKKFNLHEKPIPMRWWAKLALYIVLPFSQLGTKVTITKTNFKKFEKGGCLLICNHMSFEDMKMLQKAILPRTSFYVSSIDEFCDKEWIMRRLGCLPKKVHFTDLALVRNLIRLMKKGYMVTLYPEATYSFAGVNNVIDQGLGKLAKMANVPVYFMKNYGNYLFSPRWNTLPKNKEVPLKAELSMLVSKDDISKLSDVEVQNIINEAFVYDEYKYQRDNNIHIKNKTMAHNIERILYKCPNCLNEVTIHGEGNSFICSACNAKYEIDELSIIKNVNGESKFDSISDWYTWQRKFVEEDIKNNTYHIEFPVKISRFINAKVGFDHEFAKGIAKQDNHGIVIDGTIIKTNEPFHYEYNEKLNHTIHLTFDVKGCKESAFEVHNADDSFLIYPLDGTPIVKVRFAVEEAHKLAFKK